MPMQPAFLAALSADDLNVTGNGTEYSYVANTEIFDQGGDYNNSTGVFTAPATGRYAFIMRARLSDCTTVTNIVVDIITSNRTYTDFFSRASSSADIAGHLMCFTDMDASDTAKPTVQGNGEGADTLDLLGTSGSDEYTTFSGYLVV